MSYEQGQQELFRFFICKFQPNTPNGYIECNRLSELMAACCTPTEKTDRLDTTNYLINLMSSNSINELRAIGEELQQRIKGGQA